MDIGTFDLAFKEAFANATNSLIFDFTDVSDQTQKGCFVS